MASPTPHASHPDAPALETKPNMPSVDSEKIEVRSETNG